MGDYWEKFSPEVAAHNEELARQAREQGKIHLDRERFDGELEVTAGGALVFRWGGTISFVVAPDAYTFVVRQD